MDWRNVYTYKEILFGHKKWGSNRCHKMDEPWKHYAKWKKPDIEDKILYDSTYIKYLE